ncbi:MAG: PilZ domain-containing protein [Acidobacteria bacterium]|nr:PilZ domain-containing protein [Acidobacteriota bacterium]
MSDQRNRITPQAPAAASREAYLLQQLACNRRHHGRYSTKGEATLSWRGQAVTGAITNVSSEGMAMLVPVPIAVGQAVRVQMDRTSYQGSIRNCRVQDAGCLVGVQIAMVDDDEEASAKPDSWLEGH